MPQPHGGHHGERRRHVRVQRSERAFADAPCAREIRVRRVELPAIAREFAERCERLAEQHIVRAEQALARAQHLLKQHASLHVLAKRGLHRAHGLHEPRLQQRL